MMSHRVPSESRRPIRVVIVGAGFSGLACAKKLSTDPNIRITLIDRNNFHVFQPLLYQVGTGILSPHNAAFNLRALLRRHSNIEVKMSEVVAVDLATRTATGNSGDMHQGDYLVLAAGGQANFFDTPGASAHAYPLYSLRDAQKLRSRLIAICEAAELREGEQGQNMNIVIIGGGATGVEVAGALADLIERSAPHLFRNFDLRHMSMTLVDGGNVVLAPFSEKSQRYATATLAARGIKFRFGSHVMEVTPSDVVLSDGTRIASRVVIWAGGLKAARLSDSLALKVGRGGRVDVQADLGVPGFPGVYALGDFANCRGTSGQSLPQLASVAKQAGQHCAANIRADYQKEPLTPFDYVDSGIMAMVGRNAAIAEIGQKRHVLLGPLAFLMWIGVHVLLLNTFRVKMQTLIEWISEYLGKVNVATILDGDDVGLGSARDEGSVP